MEDEDRIAIRSLPGAEFPADGLLAGITLLGKRMLFGENKDGNDRQQQVGRCESEPATRNKKKNSLWKRMFMLFSLLSGL